MKYRSTRGKVQTSLFEDVLFSGYASDGGLFMPEKIPVVDKTTLEKWKELSYLDLTKRIMSLFIPPEEISSKELDGKLKRLTGHIVAQRYNVFGNDISTSFYVITYA